MFTIDGRYVYNGQHKNPNQIEMNTSGDIHPLLILAMGHGLPKNLPW
jgi:hypothetical protein